MKRYFGVHSTARLNDREFSLFTKKVMMLCARNLGVYIPEKHWEDDNAEDLDLEKYLEMIGYYNTD